MLVGDIRAAAHLLWHAGLTFDFQSLPMRITHLSISSVPDSVGGTETYVHHLCRALFDLGHAVAVVWHTDVARQEQATSFVEELVRLPTHLPRRRGDLYRKGTGAEPPGFRQFLTDWRPDMIHFHAFTLGTGIDHARVAREFQIPYVITYHQAGMSCQRGNLMQWGTEVCDGRIVPDRCAACTLHSRGWPKALARTVARSPVSWRYLPEGPWVVRLALPSLLSEANTAWHDFFLGSAHVVACAEFSRDVLVANGVSAERVTVLRQALPGNDRKRQLTLPLRCRGRSVRLGFFGRFTPAKGPDLLIEAIRCLRAEGIDVVGELVGPIADDYCTWAERLLHRAGGSVNFLGVKHGNDLVDWLSTLDLVVLPSRGMETGPLTLLEAWDRGIPVIGTNVGGIRDFLIAAGLPELLFGINDPLAIATAVRRVLAWDGPAPEVPIPGADGLARHMEGIYERCLVCAA